MAVYPNSERDGNERERRHSDCSLTLREAYEKHYIKGDLTPLTRNKFRHLCTSWEKHTDNPPVGEITTATVEAFRSSLLADGLKPYTVNIRWRDIRAILRRLAPPIHGNPGGLGIIENIPYVRPLKYVLPPPRRVELDDLTRFYVYCKHAQYPRVGVPPADWWRALITVAYFSGLRKGDLFRLTFGQIDLASGTIHFEAAKTGKADKLPLHPVAAEHLKRIWLPDPDARIFRGMWRIGSRIYKVWKSIDEVAQIAEPFRLHDIRRTGACEVERVRSGMAKVFLQHVERNSVTAMFYLNQMEELREAIAAMRVPNGWKPGPKMADRAEEKQRKERAEIRAAEFHVPYGANPLEWVFSPFGFRFRGSRWFKMGGKMLAILRAFVESPEPLGVEDLQKILGIGRRGALDVHPRVSDLRNRLRACFGLSDGWDPLPCLSYGNGGTWTLHIPPTVRPEVATDVTTQRLQARVEAESIRRLLRDVRKRLKLRQRELASLIGVSQTTIGNWERGRCDLSPEQAASIKAALSRLLQGGVQPKSDPKGDAA